MSKFYVGQRVRLVDPFNPWNYGATGVLSSLYPTVLTPSGRYFNCDVTWDDGDPNQMHHTSRLEPAADCYDKTEWDACAWKPEHLRVGA